jgi:hypothetical protein
VPLAYESIATGGTAPSGIASGDILVAAVIGAGGTTLASLAGWTQQASVTSSGFYSLTILTKVATGAEPGSYTFTGPPLIDAVTIARYSGGNASTVISGTPTTAASLTTGAITVAAGAMLIHVLVTSGAAISPDAAMTERSEVAGSYTATSFSDQLIAGAGSTGTRTGTTAGSSLFSGMIALDPPSTGGATVNPSLLTARTTTHLSATATGGALATITALPSTQQALLAPTVTLGARAVITALPTVTHDRLSPATVTGAALATPATLVARTATVLAATAFEYFGVTITPATISGQTVNLLAPQVVSGVTVPVGLLAGRTASLLPIAAVGVGVTVSPAILDGITRGMLPPDILTGSTALVGIAGSLQHLLYAPTVGELVARQPFSGSAYVTDGVPPVRGRATDHNGLRGRTSDTPPPVRGRMP